MVEEKKKAAAKKPAASKVAAEGVKAPAAKKAPAEKKAPAAKKATTTKASAEAAVWPFPSVEKTAEVTKPAAKKAAPKAKVAKQEVAQPSPQERYRMVETAAYYIAERSSFQGNSADHWAQAESEIAAKLAS